MNEKEEWRTIYFKDDPTNYSVSSFGRIRNDTNMKIVDQFKDKAKYHIVSLNISGKNKLFRVHRLVCEAFLPIHDPKRNEVNHKNANKEDNRISNLEWCSRKENMEHANKNALITRHKGEEHHKAVHTEEEIMTIIQLMREGHTNVEIRNKMNMDNDLKTKTLLSSIRNGRTWTHLTSQFDNIPKLGTRSIYDNKLIVSICELLSLGLSVDDIINKLKLNKKDPRFKALIVGIRSRRRFKNVSKNYIW